MLKMLRRPVGYMTKIIKDKILGKTKMKRMILDDVSLKEYVKGNLFDARKT